MSGLLATLPPSPTYSEHVIALAVIWTAVAIILAGCLAAGLWPWVRAAADRLRPSRGGLGRGRVERVTP